MHLVQPCVGLSDEGVEDAIYDCPVIHAFVGIEFAREAAPDAMTLLKLCRLLEMHGLTQRIFGAIEAHLAEEGLSANARPS